MNIKNGYSSIDMMAGYLRAGSSNQAKDNAVDGKGLSFGSVLRQAEEAKDSEGLKFSKHAGERLVSRNISLTPQQLDRLEEGKKIAEQKGIKDTLMIMDRMAFIVNVPGNMVVTAIDGAGINEGVNGREAVKNVFTNIDGAVIV